MNTLFSLSMLLAVLGIRQATACSCQPTHPQEQFCRADYVIRAKILTKKTIFPIPEPTPQPKTPSMAPLDPQENDLLFEQDLEQGQQADFPPLSLGGLFPIIEIMDPNRPIKIEYTVSIEKIYKGDNILISGTVAKVSTPSNDGICGVTNLEEKQRVLLSGSLMGGELQIRTCDFVKNFAALTKRQKQGLKYHWKRECNDCKIGVCFGHYCPSHAITNTCMLDVAPSQYDCERQFARCTRNRNDKCIWYGKKDYRECRDSKVVRLPDFMP